MSNLQLLEGTVQKTMVDFKKLASVHGAVDFEAEASFAIQAMKGSDFLQKIAMGNPDSLKYAVLNVAAIGLTLNPVSKYAYLVPRKGVVCLDISYMGLAQLAVESGAIKWIQAQLVHEKDSFHFIGVGERPAHNFSFGDRGPIVGVYCVAKTEDGEYLTEQMNIEDVYAIRDRSEAWKRNQSGPWKTDEGEMIKKTVIKRAFKMLPKNDKAGRINKAVDTLNTIEGIDFTAEIVIPASSSEQISEIVELLTMLKKEEKQFLEYFSRVVGKELEGIQDLNEQEANQAINQLKQFKKEE